jgi:hypothetical protein
MSNGERCESRPHESWSELEKRQRAEQVCENAELIQQARKRDIDSHIDKLRYERQAKVYEFMKTRHHARTVGDVEDKLRHHEVDAGVVELWIEGRMMEHDDFLEDAIIEGYPELDEAMKQMHKGP